MKLLALGSKLKIHFAFILVLALSTLSFDIVMPSIGLSEARATGTTLIALPTPVHNGAYPNWRSIASSQDGRVMVLGESLGDLYTSNDYGLTWRDTSYLFPSKSWMSIASSADGIHLAAASFGRGFYVSADSGLHWSETNLPWDAFVSVASNANGATLVVASNQGKIYRSDDYGSSWSVISSGYDSWQSVAISGDGSVVVAGSRSPDSLSLGRVIYSRNGGQTWLFARSGIFTGVAVSSDGTHLAAVASYYTALNTAPDLLWLSNDGGLNWQVDSNIGSKYWNSISTNSDGSVLVGTDGNNFYTSRDFGTTWDSNLVGYGGVVMSNNGLNLNWASYSGGGIFRSGPAEIVFDSQNGTAVPSGSFTPGGSVALPAAPARTGYTFTGWFENPTSGSALTSPYSPPVVTPITLYAQWELTKAGLVPDINSSSGSPTTDGFTLQINNYDGNFSWSGTNSAGGSVSISNTGLVTVTELAPGTSSTVTISTNRYGYYNASSTSGATAALKASQAQIAITNSILTSPANSSVNLIAVGGSGSGTTTFNVIGTGCILSGSSNDVLSTAKSGDCVVTANNPGDATYLPTSSSPVTFTFSPISQTLPVSITNTTLTSQNGSSIALAASGGSGIGDYSFSTSSAGCIITNSSLTRPTTGSCSVVATRSASGIYAAATSAPTTFTFGPALNQAKLAISNTARSATASSAIGLTTSGGTGAGAVSYAVSGGTAGATGSRCVINGSTLSTTQSGTCIVVATKAANGYYNATSSAAVTFTFTAIAQSTLTLNPTAISGTAGIPVGLGVLGGSGSGNYTFSTSTAGCTAVTTDAVAGTGTVVRSASTGSCSVTATHAASGIYSASTSGVVTITFSAAPQSNVLLSPATSTGTAGTAIALTASGGSGAGAYSFASSTSGCTVTTTNSASGTGTINRTTATGTCSITATKAANGIYASVTSAPVVVTFGAATQAALNISNANAANIAKGTTGITLAATGGSGTGAVTYAVTGTGCTLSGSKLTVATTYLAGTKVSCSVVATKAASGIYGAISSIAKVFNYL